MESVKHFGMVWKALFVVGTIIVAGWAVDARYVTATIFEAFKEGTVAAIFNRLDSIEKKTDRMDDKLDKLLEKR